MSDVQIIDLKGLVDQRPVYQVILETQNASVSLLTLGATLQSFVIDMPGFAKRDVVLGYPDWKSYQNSFQFTSNAYMGNLIGPMAGRVSKASIPWHNASWQFKPNEGAHLLHGGQVCFSNHNWKINKIEKTPFPSVTFELQEKEKFNLPGTLRCLVTYTIKATELEICIESEALEDTISNPTQHGYFNPNGHQGSVLDAQAFIFADMYLELNQKKLPSGVLLKTSENRNPNERLLLSDFHCYPHLDTAFVLNKKQHQAQLVATDGFQLLFSTNQPIFQVYIGGQTPIKGKENTQYHAFSGICLEQQAEPDAPNHRDFSNIYLAKDQKKVNLLTIHFEQ
jgi:aldose 1-epimerase